MEGTIIWVIIMLPCSMLFTGIGIYAWKRKKPMWFWSGSSVSEDEITDVRAYNRENGIMWICFSLPLWISSVLGIMNSKTGAIILFVAGMISIPVLPVVYSRIYKKYKRKE